MSRFFPRALFLLVLGIVISPHAFANTYYIAANGSDSNNGTSKTTPWLHAPGMPNCTVTCASTTPQAGDLFIFRGGDTWHFANSAASPYTGGTWNWTWAGSSASCNLNASAGSVIKTSCIYIGVDQTWYSGGSWARPILTMDNPPTTSRPSTCTFNNNGFNGIYLRASYTVFDKFDVQGECWTASPNASWITVGGNQVEVGNSYFHGWTYGSTSNNDEFRQVGWMGGAGFVLIDHNVFDGSDSSLGTTPYHASGFALGIGTEVGFNVFRHVSNGMIAGTGLLNSVHDNLFEYMYEPTASTHGNIIESNGQAPSSAPNQYFYNNVYRHTDEGIMIFLEPYPGGSLYYFNNVVYDNANELNCMLIGLPQQGTAAIKAYIYNNTFDSQADVQGNNNGGCQVSIGTGTNTSTPNTGNFLYFQNNHFVNYSSLSSVYAFEGASPSDITIADNGSEIFQSESAANAQGYTASNAYAPTTGTGATVGAGTNLAGSCSAFSYDLAFCNGTSDGSTEQAGSGGFLAVSPATPPVSRPGSGAWDAGAYEFATSSGLPAPPTGLKALVQ
ncbi:MAG TPA: hypothetical protein VKF84_03480 [Candidatus Sulfotelmatobacter sp.]|nr:hypothetical protein [Candidatus Sulfotelmatobacter sp.]